MQRFATWNQLSNLKLYRDTKLVSNADYLQCKYTTVELSSNWGQKYTFFYTR